MVGRRFFLSVIVVLGIVSMKNIGYGIFGICSCAVVPENGQVFVSVLLTFAWFFFADIPNKCVAYSLYGSVFDF